MLQTIIDTNQQHVHLQKVSRTFALTIPVLPEPIKDYISNAYLLCRIADTIEDDPIADTIKKISWLIEFGKFCENGFSDEMQLLTLHKKALVLVKEGAKDTEFALIEDMQGVVLRTMSYPQRIKQILSKGVAILSYGMANSLKGSNIETRDDVDRYCYFVAGVVGEMLAALFSEHNHKLDKQKLMMLSVSFGEGLQLTNILKDRIEDSKRNVSFLPHSDTPDEVTKEYISICQGHLDDAIKFITTIKTEEFGIRMFCFLNVLMATATLKILSQKDGLSGIKTKITRRKVKVLYVLSKLCSGNNFLVKLIFSIISLGVKRNLIDPATLRNKVSCWDSNLSDILLCKENSNV